MGKLSMVKRLNVQILLLTFMIVFSFIQADTRCPICAVDLGDSPVKKVREVPDLIEPTF